MADPRLVPVQARSANLSDLMLAKNRVTDGDKVNACPFGCQVPDLDENGYCRHLVGFADGDLTKFEPLRGPNEFGHRVVDGSDPQPVLRSDRLVRITTSYRVYRDVRPAEAGPRSGSIILPGG